MDKFKFTFTEEEKEKIRKLVEEHTKRCREVQKQKDEESYKVVEEIFPKYIWSRYA